VSQVDEFEVKLKDAYPVNEIKDFHERPIPVKDRSHKPEMVGLFQPRR
jgi:hypothetical protein